MQRELRATARGPVAPLALPVQAPNVRTGFVASGGFSIPSDYADDNAAPSAPIWPFQHRPTSGPRQGTSRGDRFSAVLPRVHKLPSEKSC